MKIGDTGSHWRSDPGRLRMENMSARNIIVAAYRIKDTEFSGPAWLDSVRYTIDAKTDSTTDEPHLLLMLQTLLADRFQLLVHRETRQVPGYALVVAKGGVKMKRSEQEGSGSRGSANKLTATNLDMPHIARFVERVVGQPVIDDTHVSGGFDFVLEYAREQRQPPEPDAAAPTLPSLFTALPEQLGLKLEARKVSIQMLIVDRAERPTEN
jgi:uncharacterized protein (TIGR03435 family)